MNNKRKSLSACLFFTVILFMILFSCEEEDISGKDGISLFDGKSLGQWKKTDFGGQGKVHVKDGAIIMEFGYDMTGITWTGDLIRMDYEISLEAMRVNGGDFFCGLTFPVNTNFCSLILGGWGGSICGLSSLDDMDASENETTEVFSFTNNKWYHVRLQVRPKSIKAWVNDGLLVDADTRDTRIGIRAEMELSVPMGIATWQTTGAVRNIRIKKLPAQAEEEW